MYTFEDNQPLIERKARLIERLANAKKEGSGEGGEPVIDKSKFKVRSIPGGIGH